MQSRNIKQANLSAECWAVQMWGIEHCKRCEYRDSEECGGKNIRETGKNEKGMPVPVN